ncbi:MAG: hypothetical protein Q7R40_10425 [Phaeospirillum sp.]|nr:hypothetical protein [Phaeospirillum sp.]
MGRSRAVSQRLCLRDTESFTTAEEAWFWYARCQIARDDGVRFTAGLGAVARPCEPDDIAREVQRLYRARVLLSCHLGVLVRFGRRLAPPDIHDDGTAAEAMLWEESLDRLTTPLRQKGIVA